MPTFIPLRTNTVCPAFLDGQGQVKTLAGYCQIDTPTLSYQGWLGKSAADGRLANLAGKPIKVAIIGAGIGGLCTAFELLRAGCADFTVFEASRRIGGRFRSQHLGPANIAELGAMRFPPAEGCLYWYIQHLQQAHAQGRQPHAIKLSADFPDPGLVPTLLSYRDRLHTLRPGEPVPEEFRTVHDGWENFTSRREPVELGGGILLPAPAQIMDWLDSGQPSSYDPVKAANAWQIYLNVFKDKSFVEGVIALFCQPKAPGGRAWRYPEDIDRFGAVGTGIGGFAPMFQIGFVAMMRAILDRLEVCQAQIVSGVESVTDALADCLIDTPYGPDRVRNHLRLNSAIDAITPSGRDLATVDLYRDGRKLGEGFTHVVLATTHRAAEIDLRIDPRWPASARHRDDQGRLLSMASCEAVAGLHIAQSSKLFVKVKPWWRTQKDAIRCITSDTTLANLYSLDYGDPDEAVCLVNYTWEDDSEKSEALGRLGPRYRRLLDDLRRIAPNYVVESLPAEIDERNAVMIDWQNAEHYYGAFQLSYPGQERWLATLFYDFRHKARADGLAKLYFVGDSYHWTGGWSEGAVQTALNAFSAIAASVGAALPDDGPLDALTPCLFRYDNPADNGAITAFGPHGGVGGERPFEPALNPASTVALYWNEGAPGDPGRMRALVVDGETFGEPLGNRVDIDADDLGAARSIKLYAFTSGKPRFHKGRVRCVEINGKRYGAAPQLGDQVYEWRDDHVGGYGVVAIIGCAGEDIDRLGFVLRRNLA